MFIPRFAGSQSEPIMTENLPWWRRSGNRLRKPANDKKALAVLTGQQLHWNHIPYLRGFLGPQSSVYYFVRGNSRGDSL